MASPLRSPSNSAPPSVSLEAGPSIFAQSPTNKRAASSSLSDSETLITKATKNACKPDMKTKSIATDAYKRKRKKKKLSITNDGCHNSKSLASGASSSGSRKGKERAIELEDGHTTYSGSDVEEKELTLLREKLEKQTLLLDAHKGFMSSLAPSITCQICLDPMHRPYTLAPCGHTGCYECLLSWFRAPPSHIALPPPAHLAINFDPEAPTLLARDAPMLLRKEKTCPHCRAVVREAPVEAWGIKDIVSHLFTNKSGMAQDMYPSYTRPEAAEAGLTQSGADAWKGVFKRMKAPTIRAIDEDIGALIYDEDAEERGERGFYDEEDDVYRCTECNHEIWDGVCSSCGRLYPGLVEGEADEDEDIDARHWMDAEEFEGFDEPIYEGADRDFQEMMDIFAPGIALDNELDGNHNHHDHGEEGYESSFIDDDDDRGSARIEEYHSAEEAGHSSSEDEEAIIDRNARLWGISSLFLRGRARTPPIAENAGRERSATIELSDSGSEDPAPVHPYQRTWASRARIESDDEDEGNSDVEIHHIGGARVGRIHGGRRAIVIDSDSERGEDEHSDIDADVEHGRNHYANSFSDEGSFSGEGSDQSSQHGDLHGSISGLSHDNYDNYAFSDEDEGINWSD